MLKNSIQNINRNSVEMDRFQYKYEMFLYCSLFLAGNHDGINDLSCSFREQNFIRQNHPYMRNATSRCGSTLIGIVLQSRGCNSLRQDVTRSGKRSARIQDQFCIARFSKQCVIFFPTTYSRVEVFCKEDIHITR